MEKWVSRKIKIFDVEGLSWQWGSRQSLRRPTKLERVPFCCLYASKFVRSLFFLLLNLKMLTKAEAACFILNLPITEENKEKALNIFEQAGMVPVYLSNGDMMSPVALGVEKVIREPWKYKKYELSHINETEEDNDYFTAPTSRKATLDLLKIIFPNNTYNTTPVFFDENEVFSILQKYLPPKHDLTADKINYWMGQDKYFPTRKRRQVNKTRKSGRDLNLVDEKLRDFT